ncbi:hypothetical protein QUF63_08930 [Anaerolineales bacterium HSG25]|nr:hypothetical protein [Anaerolineales bacterium HSG25]
MQASTAYIPIDRRQALERGETLPNRTTGAALFADISGFTQLANYHVTLQSSPTIIGGHACSVTIS